MHPVLSVSGLFCHRFANAAVLTHKVTKDSIIKVLFSSISTTAAVRQQRSISVLGSLFLAVDPLNGAATISLHFAWLPHLWGGDGHGAKPLVLPSLSTFWRRPRSSWAPDDGRYISEMSTLHFCISPAHLYPGINSFYYLSRKWNAVYANELLCDTRVMSVWELAW